MPSCGMLSPGFAPRDPCPQPGGAGWGSRSWWDAAGAAALSRVAGLDSTPSCSGAQPKQDKILSASSITVWCTDEPI